MTKFVKPQGALPFDYEGIEQRLSDGVPLMCTRKVDGMRVLFDIAEDFTVTILSRSGKPIAAINDLAGSNFDGIFWAAGRFDCEMTVKGLSFQKGTGSLRRHVPLKWTDLCIWPIQYTAIRHGNMFAKCFSTRHDDARDVAMLLSSRFGCDAGDMKPRYVIRMSDIKDYYDQAKADGYEGAIIAESLGHVRAGKVTGWWKRKPEETHDGIITGVYEGEGKHAGRLGGMVVSLENGTTTKVGTGWDDRERDRIWWEHTHNDSITGRYCELSCMELTDDGNLRFPVFEQFRDLPGSPGVKS